MRVNRQNEDVGNGMEGKEMKTLKGTEGTHVGLHSLAPNSFANSRS